MYRTLILIIVIILLLPGEFKEFVNLLTTFIHLFQPGELLNYLDLVYGNIDNSSIAENQHPQHRIPLLRLLNEDVRLFVTETGESNRKSPFKVNKPNENFHHENEIAQAYDKLRQDAIQAFDYDAAMAVTVEAVSKKHIQNGRPKSNPKSSHKRKAPVPPTAPPLPPDVDESGWFSSFEDSNNNIKTAAVNVKLFSQFRNSIRRVSNTFRRAKA